MKEGNVALAAFPQADGKTKLRPVLLLRRLPAPYNDFLVYGISSQLHRAIDNFDDPILVKDDDYNESGIIKESVIRLSFLAVASPKNIAGSIGKISEKRHQILLKRLSNYLIKK